MKLPDPLLYGTWKEWANMLVAVLRQSLAQTSVTLPSYKVADVPAALQAGQLIYVTNETGGAVPAFSDGTDWRRVTDRTVVS